MVLIEKLNKNLRQKKNTFLANIFHLPKNYLQSIKVDTQTSHIYHKMNVHYSQTIIDRYAL